MKLGTHCVLYAAAIAEDLAGTLDKVAASGSQGIEIGARFFGTDRAAELKEQLEWRHIELAGLHTLLQMPTLFDGPETALEAYRKSAEFAQIVGTKNLVSSGMVDFNAPDFGDPRLSDAAQLKTLARNLDQVSRAVFEEYGVRINYHNHIWEFANNALAFEILLNETSDLHFGMDTGWVTVAGFDPAAYIRRYGSRIAYLHLRDYSKAQVAVCRSFRELQQSAFVNVGEGNMDLYSLLKAAEETNGDNGWGIIEYEFGEKDPRRYVQAVAYFRGMCDALRQR